MQDQLNTLAATEKTLKDEAARASDRAQILAALTQTADFTEIDWQPLVNQIADLKAEKSDLEGASAELQRLDRELRKVKGQISSAEAEQRKAAESIGGLDSKIKNRLRWASGKTARRVLAEPEGELARPCFAGIADLMQAPPLVRLEISEPADCDTVAVAVRDELTARIDSARKRQTPSATGLSPRWVNSAGSTTLKPASSTIRWPPPRGTGSFTRAWLMTTSPGSRISSSGT